jgi:3'(2'), 5'-bisphosphate nucleotidase
MIRDLIIPADDANLAAELARQAGKLLLALRDSGKFSLPADAKALGKAGDAAANRFLVDALRSARPDDGLLSEESADTKLRLDKSRVWIIDPVDGTREYGEARADWAVHVGLAIDGSAAIGAVALPGIRSDVVLRSDRLAKLGEHSGPPRLVVSRTRPAAEAVAVAKSLGGELISMGSAGAKAMAIVRGEAEIYLHSGGQYEWDSCAPVAVAAAHGLHCSRIDGSPLIYNRPDTYLPDLLICRPEWAEPVLDLVYQLAGSKP